MQSQKVNSCASICEPLSTASTVDFWDWVVRISIVASLFMVSYFSISGRVFQPLVLAATKGHWSRLIIRPSLIWGTMGSLLLSFRTFLWFRYRPVPPADISNAPFLTVIIPAYNEGRMVENSIDSVAQAVYPSDHLEIIVVDDGSRDDTWKYIQYAAKRYPDLVTTIRFPRNRGKRAALEAGFVRARGEIVVTVDSDSVIERGTLLSIVGPFRNSSVGAVAGKVAVYNKREGLIPRMLHVRYILSFDFLRAAQSSYRTVYCCPGALSAYRAQAVRHVLEPWMNQTFLGEQCTYGEDRSMTNFILSLGYDVVYQRTAVVHTAAPETYKQLCRMYLRWDRSYIKEEIRFMRLIWRRPLLSRVIALVDTFITNLRYPVSYLVMVMLTIMAVNDPVTILRLLFAIGFMSFLNILFYFCSERSWDFIYGIFYSYFSFFTLFWVFPVALLTVRSRSWMTR